MPKPRPVFYVAGRWRDAFGRFAPAPPARGTVRQDAAGRWRNAAGKFIPTPTRAAPRRDEYGRFLPNVAGTARSTPPRPRAALDHPFRYQAYISRNRPRLVDRFGEARVRQAELEIRQQAKGARTDLQRVAGVGANRYPLPSFEPGGRWDTSRWGLVAGNRDVVHPTNIRLTMAARYVSADEVLGYVRETGLIDSPEYYAVLRSPTGIFYLFIAGSERTQAAKEIARREGRSKPRKHARRRPRR